ncbi:hypothetical protein ATANTOWER_023130 [Ataeniobius toweri]|uniref:Uncharacterized protein n=1 Tax=Ataeniobius toweri TaxID=208326 RepID=A0ABU7CLC3_9TELE|nr:hypothetical protein [Ataeniobius toweri]
MQRCENCHNDIENCSCDITVDDIDQESVIIDFESGTENEMEEEVVDTGVNIQTLSEKTKGTLPAPECTKSVNVDVVPTGIQGGLEMSLADKRVEEGRNVELDILVMPENREKSTQMQDIEREKIVAMHEVPGKSTRKLSIRSETDTDNDLDLTVLQRNRKKGAGTMSKKVDRARKKLS